MCEQGSATESAGSASISVEQVQRIARLARLNLTADEVQGYAGQLSNILGYVDQLKQLDVDDVEPMAHAMPVENVYRSDTPIEPLGVELALSNAPQREGSFFRIPKVLGGDTEGGG